MGEREQPAAVGREPGPPPLGRSDTEPLTTYRRRLPHWRIDGATYFVTWRLRAGLADLAPQERSLIRDAVLHFDGDRYQLGAFAVMNDHVHVLVSPLGRRRLRDIVHSWKSYSAHCIQGQRGSQGSLWQDEYFDRIVRDEAEFLEKAQYILNNPLKRWPDLSDYPWAGVGRLD